MLFMLYDPHDRKGSAISQYYEKMQLYLNVDIYMKQCIFEYNSVVETIVFHFLSYETYLVSITSLTCEMISQATVTSIQFSRSYCIFLNNYILVSIHC